MHPKTLRRIEILRKMAVEKHFTEISKCNYDSAQYWRGYLDALQEVELK